MVQTVRFSYSRDISATSATPKDKDTLLNFIIVTFVTADSQQRK